MCKSDISPSQSKYYLTLLREQQAVTREIQKVMNNHKELSLWTVDMTGALSDLAQQVVNIRGTIAGEGEWHMPEQGEQSGP
jgi:hypothetical protein